VVKFLPFDEKKLEMCKKLILPQRRFKSALVITIIASILSIFFAIIPSFQGGRYSPELAILTMTLIAVVWYTYFTFCAVHTQTPTLLQLELIITTNHRFISKITNYSPRTVTGRIHVDAWPRKQDNPLDPKELYMDNNSRCEFDVIPLGTSQFPTTMLSINNAEIDSAIVGIEVEWRDDLDESGKIGPTYYLIRDWASDDKIILTKGMLLQYSEDYQIPSNRIDT
jgi:hypothetical protein